MHREMQRQDEGQQGNDEREDPDIPITPGEEGAGPSTPGEGCGPTAGAPGEPGVVVCANAPALAASAAAAISVLLSIMAILRGYSEAISASTQSACREFGL